MRVLLSVLAASAMQPKSAIVARPKADISRLSYNDMLSTYIDFLTTHEQRCSRRSWPKSYLDNQTDDAMASIFDSENPASPLAYTSKHTALLLLDFQGLTIDRCGDVGQAALKKATIMRDWALKHQIMVVHSVVNVDGIPPPTIKGAERIANMLAEVAHDKSAAEEPTEIAFSQGDGEYIVLKPPGFVSGLKSTGAMELLREHGIRSLILCGLSTSGAVLRTAVPATDDGFVVAVIEDGCADPKEGLHGVLMSSVLPSRAHVATADEFVNAWETKGKA